MKLRIIVKQYIMLITIGLLFLTCFLFYGITLYKIEKNYNQKSQSAVADVANSAALNSAAQFIRYYDEVLTQSARNCAYTLDYDKWHTRYEDNAPLLDEKIKEANSYTDKRIDKLNK